MTEATSEARMGCMMAFDWREQSSMSHPVSRHDRVPRGGASMPFFKLALLFFAVALGTPQALAADQAVHVGMVPDAGATQVSIEEKVPLRDYLASAIGRPVELVIPTNYNATVEA